MRDDGLQDLLAGGARAQHGVGHAGQRPQEAVPTLQVVDQPLPAHRARDQVGRGLNVDLGGGRHAHRREWVSAQHDEAAAGHSLALEAEETCGVQAGGSRRPGDRRAHRVVPVVHGLGHLDPAGSRHRRVGGQQLEVLPVGRELVDGRPVEVGREQELGERDGDLPSEGGIAVRAGRR